MKSQEEINNSLNRLNKLPKVYMKMEGEDGNGMMILGRFSGAAKRTEGWTRKDIEEVSTLAMSGDYDNLLRVMIAVTTEDFSTSGGRYEEDDEE